MTKQFLIVLGASVLAVGLGVYFFYTGSSDSRLSVTGDILKVRSVEISPRNTFLMMDFRIRNTSSVIFGLRDATLYVTLADGKEKEGQTVSRPDIDTIFKFTPLAGPKYNQVLAMSDRIPGKVAIDRMVGAMFTNTGEEIDARKSVRLHLIDLDGKEFDLLEKKTTKQ